jgi:hypothetical protein
MKTTQFEKLMESVDLRKPSTIIEAANQALGLNGVSVGCEVAIIDDPTFPTAGLKGKVKKIDNGLATVELHNGDQVPLQVNQLIAL